MTLERNHDFLHSLLKELISLPKETEWVEFKENLVDSDNVGQYISALSNSAALKGKSHGYLVWGVADATHEIVGTSFNPFTSKIGNKELTNWLLQRLSPRVYFCFYKLDLDLDYKRKVIILEINSAEHTPVKFTGSEYIRIGSYKKALKDFPEIAKRLWRTLDKTPFELQSAAENVMEEDVLQLLDYPTFFDMIKLPLPENRTGIINRLSEERLIVPSIIPDKWTITNLGAILLAKKLKSFQHLKNKTVRVILYKNNSRIETIQEIEHFKGYACEFYQIFKSIDSFVPSHEVIGKALRTTVRMYPELAIRELVVNALIHQDFTISGTSPMIEIFADRLEITNPGAPIIDIIRLLDTPPRSRNEYIASFMRRIGICEIRGTGIDKVVSQTEFYQLPAPEFTIVGEHTKVTLFGHKDFNNMSTEDKIRACYLHCCLKYVNHEPMNNASLRKRFNLENTYSASISRLINLTMDNSLIKPYNENANRKVLRYIPFWA
ncbi:MAG: putative DNA binding domain-containing protein [Burkholderiales bacterium]|nr:putative DNA binding domain-containing protein [Burkholderiales bacterium]